MPKDKEKSLKRKHASEPYLGMKHNSQEWIKITVINMLKDLTGKVHIIQEQMSNVSRKVETQRVKRKCKMSETF